MKFTADIRFDASPAEVFAMLIDPAFHEQVCQATGALTHQVDVTRAGTDGDEGGGATTTTVRTLPSDDLPDFVRGFVGRTLDVRRVDQWDPAAADGSRQGTVVVEILATPVRLSGTLELTADGAGTRESIDGDLRAAVPLWGSKVEKASEPAIRGAVAKEQEIGTAWLAGRSS